MPTPARITLVLTVAAAAIASTAALAGTAARRPDLVETRLSSPPQVTEPGASFPLTDVVANRGRATARRSTTIYYLTGGEIRVAVAQRAVPRLRPRRTPRTRRP